MGACKIADLPRMILHVGRGLISDRFVTILPSKRRKVHHLYVIMAEACPREQRLPNQHRADSKKPSSVFVRFSAWWPVLHPQCFLLSTMIKFSWWRDCEVLFNEA